jgi:hypothetical protein
VKTYPGYVRGYRDPTDRRNRWRWMVASWINRLPRTCWANLVSWALGSRPLLDLRDGDDARQDSICRFDLSANGTCYCGKLRTSESTTPEEATA